MGGEWGRLQYFISARNRLSTSKLSDSVKSSAELGAGVVIDGVTLYEGSTV